MINKIVESAAEAVSEIQDGATIMIGGFGEAGSPIELIHALIDHGAKNLTVISNNTGSLLSACRKRNRAEIASPDTAPIMDPRSVPVFNHPAVAPTSMVVAGSR